MTNNDIRGVYPNLGFSNVEGFTPETFDYACPTTGLPCVEKINLISKYTRDIDEFAVQEGRAFSDKTILVSKLTEYYVAGKVIACSPEETCTLRTKMNESETRQAAVGIVRRTRKAFQKLVHPVAE